MAVLCPLHVGGGYDNPANDKMRLNLVTWSVTDRNGKAPPEEGGAKFHITLQPEAVA
jgi:hypothetical protein